MNFKNLLDLLPDCPGSKTLTLKNNPGGFRYVEKGLSGFIGPDVCPSNAITQPANPKIVIISAAGAVGKSTLANEIAFNKQAPIWDLAQASAVGENSLTGQLTSSFGFGQAGEVNGHLAAGTLFLIIDALDEARVKANQAGFEAFVQDIASMAKNKDGPAIVLLGRTQTAETTWLMLDEAGIPASLVAIQPFTREQAEQYIKERISHIDPMAAKRIATHEQPFLEARDLILNQLELAVSGKPNIKDETAREFLGYAPVLETVAVLLAGEGNYKDFISSFKSVGSQHEMERPLAVLVQVVNRLLEREQKQKLQQNIKPALERVAEETGWNEWDTLYSPDEQITRLLGRILGSDIATCPEMPAPVRSLYEERLKLFLPEHPFLREGQLPANKVFESYLFAIAMREYLTPTSKSVEQRLTAGDYKPSRLLADFYILLGENSGQQKIAERQIGSLYESLLSGETDSLRIRLSVESGDPDEPEENAAEGEGEFELVYSTPDPATAERVDFRSFKIVERHGLIAFSRSIKDANIVTGGRVVLGGRTDDFEIGPAIDIRCNDFEILSSGLVVRGIASKQKDSDAVVIEANSCISSVSKKPIVRGSLSVSWPGADTFPWNDFAMPTAASKLDTDEMHKVYLRFRRIVCSLRSHSKGSLARFKDKIDHQRLLKNEMGRALLDKLLADGILKLTGDFYHWVPDRADAFLKVSWQDLRNRRITPEMKKYFSNFITENP